MFSFLSRRQYKRFSVDWPVQFQIGSQVHRARARDVSLKGMMITCEDFVEVGKKMFIRFELPSYGLVEHRAALEAEAHVANSWMNDRTEMFEAGLELRFSDQKQQQLFNDYIHYLLGE